MKIKLINVAGAVVLGTMGSVFAGVVTGTDIIDGAGNDVIITDNSGTPIPASSGFVSLGYFTVSDTIVEAGMAPGSFKTTLDNFVSVTSGSFIDEGMYLQSADYGLGTLNAQAGRTWYTLIGNAADEDASGEFVLYQHVEVIPVDSTSPPVPGSSDIVLTGGSQLFGGVGGSKTVDATNLLGDSNYTSSISFTMTAVPEPSSTALLGLGALGFVLRRRR